MIVYLQNQPLDSVVYNTLAENTNSVSVTERVEVQ